MPRCSYCQREATLTIVSNPGTVCVEHAREFWAGLLEYACNRNVRERAMAAAGPPPRDDDTVVIAAPSQPAAANDGRDRHGRYGQNGFDHAIEARAVSSAV
jgi:hypothetical protein